MTRYFCDRCNEPVVKQGNVIITDGLHKNSYDLCPKCIAMVQLFIDGRMNFVEKEKTKGTDN